MPRARTRRLKSVDEKKPVSISTKIRNLIKEVFEENRKMNAAKKKHDKARKELYAELKAEGIDNTNIQATIGGKAYSLDAFIATSGGRSLTKIDIHKLRKLIDDETFMKVVSATQTAVKEHCPSSILNEVLVDAGSSGGTENVTVKAAK